MVNIDNFIGSENFPNKIGIVKTSCQSLVTNSIEETITKIDQIFQIQWSRNKIPLSILEDIWDHSKTVCVGWMLILNGIHVRDFDDDIIGNVKHIHQNIVHMDDFGEYLCKVQLCRIAHFVTQVPIKDLKSTLQLHPEFNFIVIMAIQKAPSCEFFTWVNDVSATVNIWEELACNKYGSLFMERLIEHCPQHQSLPKSFIDAVCKSETMTNFFGNHVVTSLYMFTYIQDDSNRIEKEVCENQRKVLSQQFRYNFNTPPVKLIYEIAHNEPDLIWNLFKNNPCVICPRWTHVFAVIKPGGTNPSLEMQNFLATKNGALYHRHLKDEVNVDIDTDMTG